jgi:SAM-dependent methyltransferase
MSDPNPSEARWASYYRANADRPPRELLRLAVSYFETSDAEARTAIDLGCGAGNETAALLKLGWRVLAIDNQPEAFARLQARISPEESARLETQQASFEQMRLPQTDLIWAGLSLPFCRPEHFDTVWAAVVDAIRPGGQATPT